MAASRRSSWIPRWRSCCSTMANRSAANGSAPLLCISSLLPPPDMNVKPQHTVLIPDRYDGDVLVNVVFHLNHRLRRLGEAGDIGKSNIVVDLLLNRYARARVVFRADE